MHFDGERHVYCGWEFRFWLCNLILIWYWQITIGLQIGSALQVFHHIHFGLIWWNFILISNKKRKNLLNMSMLKVYCGSNNIVMGTPFEAVFLLVLIFFQCSSMFDGSIWLLSRIDLVLLSPCLLFG
ncbi:unnamed protein product [Trifolium pratense]|uniref:Uncharacterized protein n=1 Tax=Trifolium pratense TaxID=57577 RepID=A0ACB0IIC9_TRIPR|nr:unnamed protein product [Trifolium pratense]